MSLSSTIIAALKFRGGVVIAADSQATDLIAQVRWKVEKLDQLGRYPLIAGFSGSLGRIQEARSKLEAIKLHPRQFTNRETVRTAIQSALQPVYRYIQQNWSSPPNPFWDVTCWGLTVMWTGDDSEILELEANGESSFHDYFHAIGSAGQTAYAIYRTLGGRRLTDVEEQKAIWIMLRILRTCIGVESWGVDDPLSVWVLTGKGPRHLSLDEIQAQLQSVDEWEEKERLHFLNS